jgi:hypothetical protein
MSPRERKALDLYAKVSQPDAETDTQAVGAGDQAPDHLTARADDGRSTDDAEVYGPPSPPEEPGLRVAGFLARQWMRLHDADGDDTAATSQMTHDFFAQQRAELSALAALLDRHRLPDSVLSALSFYPGVPVAWTWGGALWAALPSSPRALALLPEIHARFEDVKEDIRTALRGLEAFRQWREANGLTKIEDAWPAPAGDRLDHGPTS